VKAGDKFIIDTKWSGRRPPNVSRGPPSSGAGNPASPRDPMGGWATKENIISSAKNSIESLGVKQVRAACIINTSPSRSTVYILVIYISC
jgi:hypothetical protein